MRAKRTRLNEFANMPPLRHKTTEPFDHLKSEVMAWAITQPVICDYLLTTAANSGLIIFDKEARTWRGRDWKGYTF